MKNSITERFYRLSKVKNKRPEVRRGDYYNELIYKKCCKFTTNKSLLHERYLASKVFYEHFKGVMPSQKTIRKIINDKPIDRELTVHLKKLISNKEKEPKLKPVEVIEIVVRDVEKSDDFFSWRKKQA